MAKGGDIADTVGRRCLCNGLTANIGQAQHQEEGDERPLLTSGDDLVSVQCFARGRERYSAGDVIDYLLGTAYVCAAADTQRCGDEQRRT